MTTVIVLFSCGNSGTGIRTLSNLKYAYIVRFLTEDQDKLHVFPNCLNNSVAIFGMLFAFLKYRPE